MKTNPFELESLLKLRTQQRDLCRQRLGAALRRDQDQQVRLAQVQFERNTLQSELRRLSLPGEFDVEAGRTRSAYVERLSEKLDILEAERQTIVAEIEQCRESLRLADQGVAVLEKLAARRQSERAAAELRRETLEQEDAWQSLRRLDGAGG